MQSKRRLAQTFFVSASVASVAISFPFHTVDASEANHTLEYKTLRYGHVGPSVTHLQKELKEMGFYSYTIDGIYGAQTQAAVRKYQLHLGILADGIAGPQTLSTLPNFSTESSTTNTSQIQHSTPVQVKKNGYMTDGSFIQEAVQLLGTPYQWGGTTPSGFDCSGFIQFVFLTNGIKTPRTVNEIWNYGIDVKKPSIGDVVFFETYKPGPSHAGIYIGNGRFIHASTSKGVTISQLNQSYWNKRYLGSKRIVQTTEQIDFSSLF